MFFKTVKDGGPKSTVWAHWFVELKGLFSIGLLRFEDGTRDAYHNHAFNCLSWVLRGALAEEHLGQGNGYYMHWPSLRPVVTRRSTTHKVHSVGRTWVFTIRGPWADTWYEYVPLHRGSWNRPKHYYPVKLTHGRKKVK